MVIDERSRHDLFVKLEQVLGAEEAATLMEHLPPVGWADVATKHDLDQLRAATKQDIDHLRAATKQDLESFRLLWRADLADGLMNLQRHLVTILVTTVSGAMLTVGGLAFAAASLI